MNSKLVIITGNNLRHRFFVNTLAKELSVVGVVEEHKRPLRKSDIEEDNEIIKKHFKERDEKELEYFKGNDTITIDKKDILPVSFGLSNTQETFDWIKLRTPDLVIFYGCSIIKEPILSTYEGKMINMHLGLSPYYTGAGTNFWPLVNQEPECVGTTLHLPTMRVDGGPILVQVRPEVDVADTSHDIGCKAIRAGIRAMIRTIPLYLSKEMRATEQSGTGRVYKNKDFSADAVRRMWMNFQEGMIQKYLRNKHERDNRFPIIEY